MNYTEIISLISTVISLIIAFVQYRNAVRVSVFAKAALQNAAGDVCKIQQSTEWAANNLRNVMKNSVSLPDSIHKNALQLQVANALGDIVAADRLTINLFNSLMSYQQSQFQTREIRHPEQADLQLWLKELENNQQTKTK